MKKILPLLATIFLLNGCTLSMEDFSIPEEERGMDELYTEETGFGEVTYQFSDSVVNLTENLQDAYLVRVEDSVIYISPDIPRNYRPYIGQKIYAGYGYNFPGAFSGRVIEVSDEGGIYKVTTTHIDKEKIFKHLSYKFDQTVLSENTEYLEDLDDEILERLGYQRLADSTLVDWNLYDSIQASRGNEKAKARLRKRARTRAEEEHNSTETDSRYLCDWSFDTRDLSAAKTFFTLEKFNTWVKLYKKTVFPSKFQELFDPYFVFKLKVTNYSRCHAEKDEENDFEINYTDTWNEIEIGVDFGVTYKIGEAGDDEESPVIGFMDNYVMDMASGGHQKSRKEMLTMLNEMKPKSSYKKLKRSKKFLPVDGFEINKHIPFGPWFAIDINASGAPIFEVAGVLSASGTITTAKHRTGFETRNNTSIEIDEEVEESSSKFKFAGNASIKIGYAARVGVDFLFAGTAGVSIGANLEAALEGNASITIHSAETDEHGETKWLTFDGNVKFYVDFWCDFKFIVKPLGFSLWEKNIADFPDPHIHIFYWGLKYEPQLAFFTVDSKLEDGKLEAYAKLSYSSLDGLWSSFGHSYYPGVKLYLGPLDKDKNKNVVYLASDRSFKQGLPVAPDELGSAKETYGIWGNDFFKREYYFSYFNDIDPDITEVHFVPTLTAFEIGSDLTPDWNYNVKNYFYNETDLENDEVPLEIGDPSITTEKTQQTYGGECTDFEALKSGQFINSDGGSIDWTGGQSIDPDLLSLFKFMTKVRIFNASRMLECGLKVYIYNKNKEIIRRLVVPIKEPKSGFYTYQFSFVTDWVGPTEGISSDEKLYYRVIPYWHDSHIGTETKASDTKSLKYNEIAYRKNLVDIDDKDVSTWGTVMPEIDLNK